MSTFSCVVPMAEPGAQALAKLLAIRVTPTGAPTTRRLLIDVPMLRLAALESLAHRVAEVTVAPALALLGQTSLDVYVVAEFGASGLVRRLEFSRDADPQWTSSGAPRPWEADLHFAQPVDDLGDALTDWDWTEPDLDAVRAAHAAHDPTLLPRVPPMFRRTFVRFTESLGVDLEHPGASWKPPGFLARLLGRG